MAQALVQAPNEESRRALEWDPGTRLLGLAMDETGHAWVASQSNNSGTESFGVHKIDPSTCTPVQEEITTEQLLLDFEFVPHIE